MPRKINIDGAQTFFIDPRLAGGGKTVQISKIDLFFRNKPTIGQSVVGAKQPGVSLFLVPTKYGVPIISRNSGIFTGRGISHVNHRDIRVSGNARAKTTFRFDNPYEANVGEEYAMVFVYDNGEDFVLWSSVAGEPFLRNPSKISPGPSPNFVGKYYGFTEIFVDQLNGRNLDEYLSFWKPTPNRSIKCQIYAARFAVSGTPIEEYSTTKPKFYTQGGYGPIASNSSTLTYSTKLRALEFISFDEALSNKSDFVGGQMAYQNTIFHPGGTATADTLKITTTRSNTQIIANAQYSNGSSFSWHDVFPNKVYRTYIVIKKADNSATNIRRVKGITSNTILELAEPPTFTSANARIMLSPVGMVDSFTRGALFGTEYPYVVLSYSASNSTVRFVNNAIEEMSISAGGSGYSNSDVLYVTGYESVNVSVEGGYAAVANLVTNSTGGIVSVFPTNVGCGFVNTSTISTVIANSTQIGNTSANTSAGSGANVTYSIGATINTEYGNSSFKNCVVENIDFGEFVAWGKKRMWPLESNISTTFHTNYYRVDDANTISGVSYRIRYTPTERKLRYGRINRTQNYFYPPVVMSKSNEYGVKYPNGNDNNLIPNTSTNYTNSAYLEYVMDIPNDYSINDLSVPFLMFSKYSINDDATNEHTDSGNAWSKHIGKVVNFERPAEDLRVYLTAYMPSNTEIKTYARFYKTEDDEAFDDKDWTELELIGGANLVSSSIDEDDYMELEFGVYNIPKNRTKLAGTVTLANNSSTITGVGTNFTANLANGDLVYIHQPLFPNNYIITSVVSVTNTTSIVVDESTTNSSLLSDGMTIEKITYTKQAFLNPLNSNIIRYYNSNYQSYDTYDSVAIKMVYLANTLIKAPRVDDIRVIGISA